MTHAIRVSLVAVFWLVATIARADFVAFSMNEAQRRLEAGQRDAAVETLGGITQVAGMVRDAEGGDLIVVGVRDPGNKPLALDDLVVAIRALHVHKAAPLVSIDKTSDSTRSKKQVVRLEGGIENTQFGADLLAADVVLKKLALGRLPTEVWGFKSYFDLSAQREAEEEDDTRTRFWFYPPRENVLAVRDGVMAIQRVRAEVKTQLLAVGKDARQKRDVAAEQFAAGLNQHYSDLAAAYPEVGRIKPLFELVALSQGLATLPQAPDLSFWLKRYKVRRVSTPSSYPLLERSEEIHASGGRRRLVIDGGIRLKALALRLKDGDVTAMRELVLQSRSSARALSWTVPMADWQIPGSENLQLSRNASEEAQAMARIERRIGVSVDRHYRTVNGSGSGPLASAHWTPAPTRFAWNQTPRLRTSSRMPSMAGFGNIGGVMLSNAARVDGATAKKIDLSNGRFSLILEGGNARVSPESFRKFVTALWAVYFDKQDPGISIDPLGRGVKKHLVRYIGSVVNSDLGRVMREADYTMKKWAVGTERPRIRGFQSVDSLSYSHGSVTGASRRFWFVPEDMRFARSGNSVLFTGGRMTLKTEFLHNGLRGRAAPADAAFASFFTDHYEQVAERYPIYRELFEYAKLVSFAKYLKQSGVPLFWFLMANKDLVITEDSVGVVDELAKESAHRQGVTIMGGVNLGGASQYVLDAEAQAAIARARRMHGGARRSGSAAASRPEVKQSFSFKLGRQDYSVVPQHGATSGTDRRGVRYQTDLALRRGDEPSIELVRYFDPKGNREGAFGRGWDVLVPYRIRPAGENTRRFAGARIPVRMEVENLISGESDILSFSEDRYQIAGYVPAKITQSQVVGLFIMSDASFRLADKLGNEFWFDPAGALTDMRLGPKYHVKYAYLSGRTAAFETAPYEIRPVDDARVNFANARIPRRMALVDKRTGATETLVFSDKGRIAGYVPKNKDGSRAQLLAILSDGSFQLLDRHGNEFRFDGAGRFRFLLPGQKRRMLRSVTEGGRSIEFQYALAVDGALVIQKASMFEGSTGQSALSVNYVYGQDGRLARVERSTRKSGRRVATASGTRTRFRNGALPLALGSQPLALGSQPARSALDPRFWAWEANAEETKHVHNGLAEGKI